MKILVIGNQYASSSGDLAEEQEICKAINEIGHIGVFVDREHWQEAPADNYDFVFVTKNIKIIGERINEIKKKFGCPVAYWQSDHCPLIDDYSRSLWVETMRNSDIWLGRDLDSEIIRRSKLAGANYHYWNFDVACNIYQKEDPENIFNAHPQTKFPRSVPINFIGNWVHDPTRMKFLYELQKHFPANLHITTLTIREYETGQMDGKESEYKLKNLHNPLYGHNFNKLVGITKINLSIDWVNSKGFWSPRTARILAAGGFTLVKYVEGMEHSFGEDYQNVVYFRTLEECVAKIKHFLQYSEERAMVSLRGRQFVGAALRPKHRAEELIKIFERYGQPDYF